MSNDFEELQKIISERCTELNQVAETLEEQGLGDLGGTIPALRRASLDLSM